MMDEDEVENWKRADATETQVGYLIPRTILILTFIIFQPKKVLMQTRMMDENEDIINMERSYTDITKSQVIYLHIEEFFIIILNSSRVKLVMFYCSQEKMMNMNRKGNFQRTFIKKHWYVMRSIILTALESLNPLDKNFT